jgi:hypothetical protein
MNSNIRGHAIQTHIKSHNCDVKDVAMTSRKRSLTPLLPRSRQKGEQRAPPPRSFSFLSSSLLICEGRSDESCYAQSLFGCQTLLRFKNRSDGSWELWSGEPATRGPDEIHIHLRNQPRRLGSQGKPGTLTSASSGVLWSANGMCGGHHLHGGHTSVPVVGLLQVPHQGSGACCSVEEWFASYVPCLLERLELVCGICLGVRWAVSRIVSRVQCALHLDLRISLNSL